MQFGFMVVNLISNVFSCVEEDQFMEMRPGLVLADDGLKFERADLHIIRWMCD